MRRYLITDIIAKNKAIKTINAAVKGWKVRKIMSGCREVLAVKRNIREL
jgi:hypothetical protein